MKKLFNALIALIALVVLFTSVSVPAVMSAGASNQAT